MAERRMFARSIIDSDAFLDLPPWAQLLYFHMGMRADDDGFLDKPRSILRLTGCKPRDLQALLDAGFLLEFDSGVMVIRHWRTHNYIRCDRYKPTAYTEEKKSLGIEKSGAYVRCQPGGIPGGIPGDGQVATMRDTQDRLGKDRLGQDSPGQDSLGQDSLDQDRFHTAVGESEAQPWCVPPSAAEVMIYCKQRKNNVDAERFVDYYRQEKPPRNHKLVDWKEMIELWEVGR